MKEARKHLFEQSSQFRKWIFKQKEIDDIRQSVNESSAKDTIGAIKQERELGGSWEQGDQITAKEQLDLVTFFESRIINYCKVFKFDVSVQRFYLKHSIMDYDPKILLLTALFLAAKVENSYVELSKFLQKIPKAPEPSQILRLEFEMSRGLDFEFQIQHPYWALHGLYLDMQSAIDNESTTKQDVTALLNELSVAYANARELVTTSYLSDAILLFWPSQIALAAFVAAARGSRISQTIQDFISNKLERECERIATLNGLEGDDVFKKFLSTIDSIESLLKTSTGSQVDKEIAKEISSKLSKFRNPAFDPESRLFLKNQKEKMEAEQTKKKLKTQ